MSEARSQAWKQLARVLGDVVVLSTDEFRDAAELRERLEQAIQEKPRMVIFVSSLGQSEPEWFWSTLFGGKGWRYHLWPSGEVLVFPE